jgi:Uma2 family endonuclease
MQAPESSLSPPPEPTWEVAHLFPPQGHWTESEFFELHSNRMVELADGRLEVLPMPTWLHQLIVDFLADLLKQQVRHDVRGRVLQAPLPIRLFPQTIREPDVMYFAPGSEPDDPRGYPTKVDLAMEVVSEGVEARRRDYEDKRRDYAQAGVPEYWIVDPEGQKIVVLVLQDKVYQTHGEFGIGDQATGKLIPNLRVDVAELMKLGESS